jgi:hypothetical protein
MIITLIGDNDFELSNRINHIMDGVNSLDIVTLSNDYTYDDFIREIGVNPILSVFRLVIVENISSLPKDKSLIPAIESNKVPNCKLIFKLKNFASNRYLKQWLQPNVENIINPQNKNDLRSYVDRIAERRGVEKYNFEFLIYWVGDNDFWDMDNIFRLAVANGEGDNVSEYTIMKYSYRKTDMNIFEFISMVFSRSEDSLSRALEFLWQEPDTSKLLNFLIKRFNQCIQVKGSKSHITLGINHYVIKKIRKDVANLEMEVIEDYLLKLQAIRFGYNSRAVKRAYLCNFIIHFKEELN